jgi:glycine hydroxymethyltransferase
VTNNQKYFQKIQRGVFPGLVSNHHLWRFPPLAVTLLEILEHGAAYAKKTIQNAQALARALDAEGFRVLAKSQGYTKSHQVLLDVSEYTTGYKAAVLLEEANVICNKNLLYSDHIDRMAEPSGLRLGTQELTRRGLSEDEMKIVAGFYRRVIIDGDAPEQVSRDVTTFVAQFPHIKYAQEEN